MEIDREGRMRGRDTKERVGGVVRWWRRRD